MNSTYSVSNPLRPVSRQIASNDQSQPRKIAAWCANLFRFLYPFVYLCARSTLDCVNRGATVAGPVALAVQCRIILNLASIGLSQHTNGMEGLKYGKCVVGVNNKVDKRFKSQTALEDSAANALATFKGGSFTRNIRYSRATPVEAKKKRRGCKSAVHQESGLMIGHREQQSLIDSGGSSGWKSKLKRWIAAWKEPNFRPNGLTDRIQDCMAN